ncbi:MAG: potassium-transporting ATPase potassium-binding subunit [Chloroflexota bacterium]|jgi:K+-transporting ATPase ATPase A chain|nr:potassium-transporting ATPase potassium-binding subunit [Chloroflexota bacterium]
MGYEIAGFVVTFLAVFVVAWFLGGYMFTVFRGQRTILSPVLRPVERGCYRLMGVDEDREQSWVGYLVAMLLVTVISVLFTYVLLRIQDRLPFQAQLNPNHLPAVPADLSLNTAISFSTNTNWQNYAGEQSMTYLSQMLALAFHQFLSAATGIALAIALVRGLVRRSGRTIGNFYVDITRATLYLLLPISVVATLVLVSQGAIQNLNAYTTVHTLEGGIQTIAQGPVASMEAIKDLGTNGGGFFNANSAHPYENPNAFTNAFQILLVLCIPFGLAFTFGRYARNVRQGIAIFAAMAIVLVSGAAFAAYQEQSGNPALARAGATWTSTAQQSGGNMEGKSVRFGAIQSAQYGAATTGTSTGSVDSAHDSWTPLGGMVPMVLIQLGEITPGGVGSGLYGMLVFAILAVFIAGLMVGRTPEYLGKKIESREVKLAALGILALPASILGFTAVSVLASRGQAGPLNPGPHGFSEILYAFSSTTGNNGSAFAGLSGNTVYYNTTLSAAMWIGRFIFLIPLLALAGSMVRKKVVPASAGTFPTDTPLFSGLLIGVILIVGALTFFPALALGPILEHLQLHAGQLAH